MKYYRPDKIYIQKAAQGFATTERILSKLSDVPTEVIEETRPLIDSLKSKRNPIGEGKRYLLLAYDQGNPFRLFSESENYLACDYYTLHVVEGCDLECSYCILQAYLTNPLLTVFVNTEEMLERLQAVLNENPDQYYRIGIGQLADALSLDHLTEFSKTLVPFFAKQSNCVLELKTKSINIDNLLNLAPENKTIVSWSINTDKIQKEEEHKCASIDERLGAAKKIAAIPGYRLGFHLDPIIDYEGWEKDYEATINKLFKTISPDQIAWMSLGCLRMMNPLKSIMQERFPKSRLASAEWIKGMDGKLRYFKLRRIEIYQTLVAMIRKHAPELTLYLSMESPEVWRKVLGWEPKKEELCQLLDGAGQGRKVNLTA